MNKLFTLLLRGVPNAAPFARHVQPTPLAALTTRPDILQRLVPANPDLGYMNWCADQLCQLCRKSRYGADLLRLDAEHTYAAEFDMLPVSTLWTGLPAGVTGHLLEPDICHEWAVRELDLAYTGATLDINGRPEPLAWSSAGSTSVPTGLGLALLFSGPDPGPFAATLALVRQPRRSLLHLDADLTGCQVPWHAPYKAGREALDPETRIAAFVLNYLERDAR